MSTISDLKFTLILAFIAVSALPLSANAGGWGHGPSFGQAKKNNPSNRSGCQKRRGCRKESSF